MRGAYRHSEERTPRTREGESALLSRKKAIAAAEASSAVTEKEHIRPNRLNLEDASREVRRQAVVQRGQKVRWRAL